MKEDKNKTRKIKIAVALAIFFVFIIIPLGAYAYFEWRYHDRILPNIYVGNIPLAGLSREQAKAILNNRVNKINQEGIEFYYHNQGSTLYPIISSLSGDVAIEAIIYDVDSSVEQIYQYGRGRSALNNLFFKVSSWIEPRHIGILNTINEPQVDAFLTESFSHFATPAQDARLVYSRASAYAPVKFDVEEEKYGQILDLAAAKAELKSRVSSLDPATINLAAILDYPKIYKQDVLNIDAQAQDIINNLPFTLAYGRHNWQLDKNTVLDWLTLETDTSTGSKNKIIIGLSDEAVAAFLDEKIAPEINQGPIDAKFEIKDGKVAEFQVSQDGLELNVDSTIKNLKIALVQDNESRLELPVKEVKSELGTNDINDMGVKELIGVGHSNFSGSPVNRRHNIAVGAASINGTLIAPNEEFSLLNVLGEIEKKTGYLPELVIKEGKTIPEYGGGLCQIGTTMFRGTVDSGLPVTMRRNHSYRVSYYEPAGTDATIYNPWPDYKFINDTGSHILLQSRIEGDDLYFEFWGTRDGRLATQTKPVIYNITRPPATKIIETLDLEPGVKKCTEHAHNGADAYFDYTVTYADGTVDETRFKSHYVPWREVCLLGVEKLSTTTEAIIE